MGQFVMLAEEVVGDSTPTAIESLLSTLGSVVSQLINYVGSVWSLISAHPIALIWLAITDATFTGKDGKTYVAVPRPDRLIPLLKKVVQKMLGAFGWSHGMQKKTQEHVEHMRVSF